MKKQDRQGVRTAADLERKYNLGEVRKTFNEVRNNSYLSTENLNKMGEQIRAEIKAELQSYARKEDLVPYATDADVANVSNEIMLVRDDLLDVDVKLYGIDQTTSAINESISTINESINGSWRPLTLGDGFIARGNASNLKPVYKATGCVITVCGIVSNTAAMTVPAEGVVIAKGIAVEHRPHMDHHFVCQSANMDLWRCAVKTDGTVTLARLGSTTARDLGANTWLPFTVTYQI